MRPRVAFGIQSAVHAASTLQQLVGALGDSPVVIHHDFSQQPDFAVRGPNVHFVPQPVRTGWADWGLILGIQKSIDYCLEHFDFDYFQLLSPVDLPIRPVAEFRSFLAQDGRDFHCDAVSLDDDELAFLTFAYRAYAKERSLSYRALWRLWLTYFGPEPATESRAGLAIPTSGRCGSDGRLLPAARAAARVTHLMVERLRERDRLLGRFRIHMGGMWFGASRRGCEHLSRRLRDPEVLARFKPYFCAGEMLINTVIAESGLSYGPANHAISPYLGARPQWIESGDLDALRATGKHFARKFPDDAEAGVRLALLRILREEERQPSQALDGSIDRPDEVGSFGEPGEDGSFSEPGEVGAVVAAPAAPGSIPRARTSPGSDVPGLTAAAPLPVSATPSAPTGSLVPSHRASEAAEAANFQAAAPQ